MSPNQMEWDHRLDLECRARNITPAQEKALRTLPSFRGRGGIYPSHRAIAARAGVSVSTVERALVNARESGLVDWMPRRHGGRGRRFRSSNLYFLNIPKRRVRIWRRRRTGRGHTNRQLARGQEKEIVREIRSYWGTAMSSQGETETRPAPDADLLERRQRQFARGIVRPQEAPPRPPRDLLEARRQAMEAQLRARVAERQRTAHDSSASRLPERRTRADGPDFTG